ncbi:uncharacterized protein TNCV_5027491 [Trichonephila clavipes]|nr:uncharacterized protein TNCV_5027491 [Trichonephila clavipes]
MPFSENKPYGDDYLIQKIECVGHVQKRMGRLTDSLIDKLAHYYGNAIRCNSTSVKEMRKAIWAVWGHSCSTDDEPIHWFCPTNPNTWCKYNAAINNNLQNYKHKPSVAKAVQDVIKPVFADLSHPALLKKCLGEQQIRCFFVFQVPDSPLRQKHDKFQGLGLRWPGRQSHMLLVISRICTVSEEFRKNAIFHPGHQEPAALRKSSPSKVLFTLASGNTRNSVGITLPSMYRSTTVLRAIMVCRIPSAIINEILLCS